MQLIEKKAWYIIKQTTVIMLVGIILSACYWVYSAHEYAANYVTDTQFLISKAGITFKSAVFEFDKMPRFERQHRIMFFLSLLTICSILSFYLGKRKLSEEEIRKLNQQLQRRNEELNEANANLEDLVAERTRELEKTVADLQAVNKDLQLSENVLKESEFAYRSLVKNIPGMIYRGYTDWSGEIIKGIEDVSGYSTKELLSMENKWLDIIHPDDRERVYQEQVDFSKNPSSLIQTYRILHKDGNERWVEDHKISRSSQTSNLLRIEGILFDITQRIALERQLRQSSKLKALGIMSSGISHEFNNILEIISGNIELALMQMHDTEFVAKRLKNVEVACQRSANIVNKIKLFSKNLNLTLEPLDLTSIIEECTQSLADSLSSHVQLKVQMESTPCFIMGDSSMLIQMITNIVNNATQAMHETGGVLELVLQTRETGEGHSALKPGGYASIVIKDSGPGIDSQIIEKIFDPFFTTKPASQGTGLGLAICKNIAREHKGEIKVQSSSAGTCFEILLPTTSPHLKKRLTKILSKKGAMFFW